MIAGFAFFYVGYDYAWPFIGSLYIGRSIAFMEQLVEVAADEGDVEGLLSSTSASLFFNYLGITESC